MERVALHYFPFPHVLRGVRYDGYSVSWPKPCSNCDRQCEESTSPDLELCSYGVNFQRFDKDLLVAGVVVRDFPTVTQARRKALKLVGSGTVTRAEIEAALKHTKDWDSSLVNDLREQKDAVIAEYRESKGYQSEILEQLRPEMERELGQMHDYKQFVQQIIHNMNVLLAERYPDAGEELEDMLEVATNEEVAIYWAARLMEEKLDAYLYLSYPDRINDDRSWFRFHGLVTKYRKIYQGQLESKHLRMSINGQSWGDVYGNSRAISLIPHTLIDNAIKYAPEGTSVDLNFSETDDNISFSVGSFGPRIHGREREKIFDVFFRGRAAREWDSEGIGFGLASAQNIAKAIGTVIKVKQDSASGPEGSHWTVFSVELSRAHWP